EYIDGMFAFALWDSRRQKLLLARDRLGIKPLFYTCRHQTLAFASEIKSLLLLPGCDAAVSSRGVFEYFSQHFIPGADTIYRDIRKLRPGELLVLAEGKLRFKQYWQASVTCGRERRPTEWCEELRHRLTEAVQGQLVADVPLGVFLSGGIDSSAITAVMARSGLNEVRTFSVGFDVPKYDETRYAQLVSRYLGTTHETFRLTAASTDILPQLLWHLDEPLADATIIPTYLLSDRTRRHVTVALSGEGGDELFAGYTQYQGMQLNRALSRLPLGVRRRLAALAALLPSFGSASLGYWGHRLERIAASSQFPLFEGYTRKVAFFSPEEQQRLFSAEFQRQVAAFPYLDHLWSVARAHPELEPLAQANLADLTVYLPDALLMKVDRMSMACSLEVRV
ncbi:MAG: asparagine synthase (glutamine-hydrolyzing), partial [Deltaproteobacteria bacterium]|nr:asparagine synthase (glutamine-hydrolyzing) [Deltaproteobacteria bacterium]